MPAPLSKSTEYQSLLASLKQRIQEAQVRAGLAVNRELVLLYWSIGREILSRQQEQGWGAKVIDSLARDLRRSFPGMQGLSPRNLKYMRAFAEAWTKDPLRNNISTPGCFELSWMGCMSWLVCETGSGLWKVYWTRGRDAC